MNSFVVGPRKGCQLLLQKTPLAHSRAGSPSAGPPGSPGFREGPGGALDPSKRRGEGPACCPAIC